jgi:3-oxoacyl-[acyl-carrier-protein] synthase II
MPKVLVTGLGAVTPIGDTAPAFFDGLMTGRSGVVDFAALPEMQGYPMTREQVSRAGVLRSRELLGRFDEALRARFDPQTLTVLAAVKEALVDARVQSPGDSVAILVGSAVGLRPAIARMRKAFPAYAQFSVSLLPEPRLYANNFADEFASSTIVRAIAQECIPRSLAIPFCSLCVSGANAVVLGVELLRAGVADRALAIGFDFFHPRQNQVFSHFRLLTDLPSRPFDAERTGYQLGEAVGVVFLETERSAASRGGVPYAEVAGVGTTNDGHHMVIPEPSGKAQYEAMATALANAAMESAQLDAIAAIGRGSMVADQAEARALARLLGNALPRVPINSLVPNTGYTLGASSMLNFIALMMEMKAGTLFPTLNVRTLDPRVGKLDLVRECPRAVHIRSALSLGSAFLGSNTAIAVRCPSLPTEAPA